MLPKLQAEQQLQQIEAASAPYMKREGHRDLMRRIKDMLGRDSVNREPADAQKLAAIGISIVTVEGGDQADG